VFIIAKLTSRFCALASRRLPIKSYSLPVQLYQPLPSAAPVDHLDQLLAFSSVELEVHRLQKSSSPLEKPLSQRNGYAVKTELRSTRGHTSRADDIYGPTSKRHFAPFSLAILPPPWPSLHQPNHNSPPVLPPRSITDPGLYSSSPKLNGPSSFATYPPLAPRFRAPTNVIHPTQRLPYSSYPMSGCEALPIVGSATLSLGSTFTSFAPPPPPTPTTSKVDGQRMFSSAPTSSSSRSSASPPATTNMDDDRIISPPPTPSQLHWPVQIHPCEEQFPRQVLGQLVSPPITLAATQQDPMPPRLIAPPQLRPKLSRVESIDMTLPAPKRRNNSLASASMPPFYYHRRDSRSMRLPSIRSLFLLRNTEADHCTLYQSVSVRGGKGRPGGDAALPSIKRWYPSSQQLENNTRSNKLLGMPGMARKRSFHETFV
jgi:hypothetical protein